MFIQLPIFSDRENYNRQLTMELVTYYITQEKGFILAICLCFFLGSFQNQHLTKEMTLRYLLLSFAAYFNVFFSIEIFINQHLTMEII